MICKKCGCDKFKELDKNVYNCWICGEILKPDEETEMPKKCSFPGCKKFDVINGLCTEHNIDAGFGEAINEKNAARRSGRNGAVHLSEHSPEMNILPEPDNLLIPSDSTELTIMSIIDAEWAKARQGILSDLQGLDGKAQLEYALGVITALQEK